MDNTADTEASGAVSIRASTLGRALRAGVAGAVRGGGAGWRALLVRELDNGEQGKSL